MQNFHYTKNRGIPQNSTKSATRILCNLGQFRILYRIYGIKKTYRIPYKQNSENTLTKHYLLQLCFFLLGGGGYWGQ
jgi:hypothetical protein